MQVPPPATNLFRCRRRPVLFIIQRLQLIQGSNTKIVVNGGVLAALPRRFVAHVVQVLLVAGKRLRQCAVRVLVVRKDKGLLHATEVYAESALFERVVRAVDIFPVNHKDAGVFHVGKGVVADCDILVIAVFRPFPVHHALGVFVGANAPLEVGELAVLNEDILVRRPVKAAPVYAQASGEGIGGVQIDGLFRIRRFFRHAGESAVAHCQIFCGVNLQKMADVHVQKAYAADLHILAVGGENGLGLLDIFQIDCHFSRTDEFYIFGAVVSVCLFLLGASDSGIHYMENGFSWLKAGLSGLIQLHYLNAVFEFDCDVGGDEQGAGNLVCALFQCQHAAALFLDFFEISPQDKILFRVFVKVLAVAVSFFYRCLRADGKIFLRLCDASKEQRRTQ